LTFNKSHITLNTMLIKHSNEVGKELPTLEGTKDCTLRWLIRKDDGAEHYAMRLFELEPGGIIPLHSHEDTEHEIFIIEGEGILNDGEKDIPVQQGDVIFVEPDEKHGFVNNTNNSFKFICVIPIK